MSPNYSLPWTCTSKTTGSSGNASSNSSQDDSAFHDYSNYSNPVNAKTVESPDYEEVTEASAKLMANLFVAQRPLASAPMAYSGVAESGSGVGGDKAKILQSVVFCIHKVRTVKRNRKIKGAI